MAVVRSSLAVAAVITAPAFVFEPHLRSTPNPEKISEYERKRLSQLAQAGADIYDTTCQSCHGQKGFGSNIAPALDRDIFHRGDRIQKEFHMAITDGGDGQGGVHGGLPAAGLSFNDIEVVARYVREVRMLETRNQ